LIICVFIQMEIQIKQMNSTWKLVLISFLIFSSCNSNQNLITIDAEAFINRNILLSEIASDVIWIPISSDQKIKSILLINVLNEKIFLSAHPHGIWALDFQGNFLYDIGKKGKGPGEYYYYGEWAIDELNERMFVLDRNAIKIYGIDGRYTRTIDISAYNAVFDAIAFKSDSIYLFENIKYGRAKYNWLIIDDQGREVGARYNSYPEFQSRAEKYSRLFFRYNNNFRYWNTLNDTIFEMSGSSSVSKYLFAKGQNRLSSQNYDDIENFSRKIFQPSDIFETDKYLFVNYFMEKKHGIAMFDKQKNVVFSMEQEDQGIGKDYGFINDLDCGVNFSPMEMIDIGSKIYFMGWVDVYQLKTHVASETFKAATPKYPEKKLQLEQLANSLNDNDNPVLMLVKLKE
jgi:hypothetical protein